MFFLQRKPEDLLEGPDHRPAHCFEFERRARGERNRRHARTGQPAGDDRRERRRIIRDVERQPVPRHSFRDPDPHRRDLATPHPHPAHPRTPPGAHSERIQRPDEHLLQTIYVRFRPVTVRPQPENGVSHQLARPVVGHGAAPVRAQHWNSVDYPPCPPLTDMRRAGGASQCIDRKMLREQQGVADRVLHTRLVQSHLEARSFLIVSQAEIKQVADHLVTGRLSWTFSWVDLRTTDRVTVGDVDPSLSSACQRSDMLYTWVRSTAETTSPSRRPA